MDTDAHYQLVLLQKRPICALWGSSLTSKQAWHRHKLNLNRKCCTLYPSEWKSSFHWQRDKMFLIRSVCMQYNRDIVLTVQNVPMRVLTNNNALSFLLPASPGIFSVGWVTLHLHKCHRSFFSILRYLIFWQLCSVTHTGLRGRTAPSLAFHAWHHRVCF